MVNARAGHQLIVAALLNELPSVEHQDRIGMADRRKAVRDNEIRSVLAKRRHRSLN